MIGLGGNKHHNNERDAISGTQQGETVMEPADMPPPIPGENIEPNESVTIQQRSGVATASLVLGLLSFACLPGPLGAIPAIICGIIALAKIGGSRGTLRGSGFAIAGISLGAVAIVATFLLLPLFALKAIAPNRETVSRSSCQNNLKQMGLVFKMFANEEKKQYYPELSPDPGQLMCMAKGVFPEYLMDVSILHCPSNTTPQDKTKSPETLINDDSYTYLGYVITTDEQFEAFAAVYKDRIEKKLPFDCDLDAPQGKGSFGSDKFYRLREGIERFGIKDINDPASAAIVQSQIPIMWDKFGAQASNMNFNHIPGGSNVLFMDGHVEYRRYPGEFPVSRKAAEILGELQSITGAK
jgi:prepilin-type processing-associated H-X9-DG protein